MVTTRVMVPSDLIAPPLFRPDPGASDCTSQVSAPATLIRHGAKMLDVRRPI